MNDKEKAPARADPAPSSGKIANQPSPDDVLRKLLQTPPRPKKPAPKKAEST